MEVLQDYHGRLLSAPSERTDARTIEPGNGGREIGEKDVGSDHGGEPSPWTMGKMSILDLLAAVDEVSPTCSGDSDDGSDSGGEVGCLGSGDEESVETVNHRPQPEEYAALAWLGCRADIDGDGDGENEDEGDPFLELMINAVAKGEERRGGKTPSRLIFAMLRRRAASMLALFALKDVAVGAAVPTRLVSGLDCFG
ncbi:uncharacterized protein KY384_005702 [Bacidia gigantensis]|uniref:uncharacterized protein n=1 Tax=Bacidia gigantensis TaxID=2732470 RepID=UPI001D04881E|nr:uncharacterized protein KY384_005702 [Bacidia gigantensis]KAG8529067.1 hypothetical protein KY384_005702 [Bacidia gigantensis]